MKRILTLFLVIAFILLTSCRATGKLRTNPDMQEMLEAREPGIPIYNPPDKSIEACEKGHISHWIITDGGHYEACRKCGAVLSSEEKHETAVRTADGYIVMDEGIYIKETDRCRCGIVIKKTYIPASYEKGGS